MGICGIRKKFPKTFNTTNGNCMPFEWIGTIPTGEDSDGKSLSFLQHPPRYARWGIPLIGQEHIRTGNQSKSV